MTWRYVFACIAYTSNPAKRFLLNLPIVREYIALRNEQLENHTLSRSTYPYSSLYTGVPPPQPGRSGENWKDLSAGGSDKKENVQYQEPISRYPW